jgi:hypothetical protein
MQWSQLEVHLGQPSSLQHQCRFCSSIKLLHCFYNYLIALCGDALCTCWCSAMKLAQERTPCGTVGHTTSCRRLVLRILSAGMERHRVEVLPCHRSNLEQLVPAKLLVFFLEHDLPEDSRRSPATTNRQYAYSVQLGHPRLSCVAYTLKLLKFVVEALDVAQACSCRPGAWGSGAHDSMWSSFEQG